MKITAFILSMYVLFLASLPTLSIMDVFPEVVCCINDHDEHQEDEGGGCSEVCNPFLFCQCCPGFTTIVADYPSRFDPDRDCSGNSRVKQLSPRQVIFPVWHPPRA